MISPAFRRTVITFAAFLFVLASLTGFAAESKNTGKKHFLWKVTSPTNTVYLLGSLHLLKQSDYPLASEYEKAYAESKKVYFEVNLNGADEQKLKRITLDKSTYGSMQSLSTALSKEAYDQVKQKLSELGIGIEQAEKLRPWILAMTIAVAELQRLGFDPDQGVDRYFTDRAAGDGKKILGFETAEYQLGLLADMPDRVQEQMLLQTLRDLKEAELHFGEIHAAWEQGDAGRMEAYLFKGFEEYPTVYQRLIVERNKKWLPEIERVLGQKEQTLIVVGAAHLIGKDGIIAALKRKGYQVQQQ